MSDLFKVFGTRIELPEARECGWVFSPRPGGSWIAERTTEDGTTERRRFFIHEGRGRLSVNLGGRIFTGEILQARSGQGVAAGSDSDLIAQFPGKVRKVLVAQGAQVEAGTPLLLIEAMKMEFAVKAPFAGTIRALLVKEGQQLSPGDRFVELEEAKSDGA